MEIRRSILSVPGHVTKMHAKAAQSNADVIMLDLEDSVPADSKECARKTIVNSINSLDWRDKLLTLRINSVDTSYAYEDIIYIVERCNSALKSIVVPKVNHEGDIYFLDRLLNSLELKLESKNQIKLEASIETAKGLERIREIASSSCRLVSLVFGIADYTTSIGAPLVSMSGHGENDDILYPGNRWQYVLSRLVTVAKAYNLFAVDAPYGNFKDLEGLRKSAFTSRLLGFDGKWVIHPNQIDTVNEVYAPSKEEIERAQKIIELHLKAEKGNKGAVALDGHMIDSATLHLAQKIWDTANKLGLV